MRYLVQNRFRRSVYPPRQIPTYLYEGIDVFYTNFTYVGVGEDPNDRLVDTPNLVFKYRYKPEPEFWGDLNQADCTPLPAIVEYPVFVTNDAISLDPGSNYTSDCVLEFLPGIKQANNGLGTTHGPIKIISNSNIHLNWRGSNFGYDFVTKGVAASQYATGVGNTTDSEKARTCALTWSVPKSDMLGNAREIAFRAALHAANDTDLQTVLAFSRNSRTVYTSNYRYLGFALFFTLLALLCIVPALSSYLILGRHFSLSPIEVAKAFDASLLRNSDANLGAEELLK